MKVYLPLQNRQDPYCLFPRDHELFFLYGCNKFKFVDDLNEADCVPINADITDELIKDLASKIQDKNKTILILQTTHASEGDGHVHCYKTLTKIQEYFINSFYVIQNISLKDFQSIIFTDYCFNRQKAYFTEYHRYDLSDRIFSGLSTEKMYALSKIKTLDNVSKKFLIPNNIYVHNQSEYESSRIKARLLIKNLSKEEDCYFTTENKRLDTEEITDRLQALLDESKHGYAFLPVANRYYEDSIVSVYGETIVHGRLGVRYISEKTWNPLIKGHFILPLAYPGIIRDLEQIYGFKFPDWIDYSYDAYVDDEKRFIEFEKSLNKLRDKPLSELLNLRNRDIAILEHNRNIFYTRGYDVFYDRLQEKLAGLM